MDKITKKSWRKGRVALAGLLVAALAVGGSFGLSAAAQRQTVIPQEKEYAFETPSLSGTDAMLLQQQNPDRGLRMEVYMNVATRKSLFKHADEDAMAQLEDEIALYSTDSPKLVQVYFYLTDYKDKDLDDTAFQNMNDYFDLLKEHGVKAVLRFAYISDDTKPLTQEPSSEQVVRHMEQLKGFIEERQDQITVFQAGLIGAWGEWDGAARNRMNEKMVLNAVLDNTPKDMYIQVRYLNIKNNNLSKNDPENWNRVGFHDDFLIGNLHGWNTAGSDPNSSGWKQMTEESANLLVDGEMIWGSANDMYTGGNSIDAIKTAARLKEHHFTSLSLTHNYKEQGGLYSMYDWQSEYVNQSILDQNGLPYDEAWFTDSEGKNLPRTMFDYIRDYLGYYLKAEGASAKVSGSSVDVSLNLTNYGFAAPLALASFDIALLDAEGNVVDQKTGCALSELQPGSHAISVSLTKPQDDRAYSVAVSLKADDGTPVRLANDLQFQDGWSHLGVLK